MPAQLKQDIQVNDAVLIGIAPVGGRLPEQWRTWLAEALDAGCDIWSGLHSFLSDDPMLVEKAKGDLGYIQTEVVHDAKRNRLGLAFDARAWSVCPVVFVRMQQGMGQFVSQGLGTEERRPVPGHHDSLRVAFRVIAAGAAPVRIIRYDQFHF